MPDFFVPDPSKNGNVSHFPEMNTNWSYQGSPEGKIPAPPNYTCKDTTNGDLYVKDSGEWTKDGWVRYGDS